VSPGSPGGTTYTLQFLPYSLVCQAAPSLIHVSLSQPDLRSYGAAGQVATDLHGVLGGFITPPASMSRCSSLSPTRCLSPALQSPRNGSCFSTRPGTPTHACSRSPSRPATPTILINSEELFYAGGAEYYGGDLPRGAAFSRKPASPACKKSGNGNGRSPAACHEAFRRPSMCANWEKSLEVERSEGRKYSLTDEATFPQPEKLRDRSPLRDTNNNNSRRRIRPDSSCNDSWPASTCCCFNDLCCKVCLVFNKEDSSLTLEQLQNRAVANIMKQRRPDTSGGSACGCDVCRPGRMRPSPDVAVVPAKKAMLKSPDAPKKKANGLSRYQQRESMFFLQKSKLSKIRHRFSKMFYVPLFLK
jgi:hypothetical protein